MNVKLCSSMILIHYCQEFESQLCMLVLPFLKFYPIWNILKVVQREGEISHSWTNGCNHAFIPSYNSEFLLITLSVNRQELLKYIFLHNWQLSFQGSLEPSFWQLVRTWDSGHLIPLKHLWEFWLCGLSVLWNKISV